MSVIPAVQNFVFQQNGTWEFTTRFCSGYKQVTFDPLTGLFSATEAHGFTAGTIVVLALTGEGQLPPNFLQNEPYYVLADGLSATAFKLSATAGGAAITSTTAGDGDFVAAAVIDITTDTIDCDVATAFDPNTLVTTFVVTKTDPTKGLASFRVAPTTTATIEPGSYRYDVSRTTAGGDRYYYYKGTITVESTVSRNT